MTDVVAVFDRSKLKVQGDGRPFSLGTVIPAAKLRFFDVRPLTIPLNIDAKRKWALTHQIRAIMAIYLGPALLAERLADHATTLTLLPQITRACVKLADHLEMLDGPVLRAIEANRWELDDGSNVPPYDLLPLVRKLRRLSRAVRRTHDSMRPNAEGPRQKKWLDQTVVQLVGVIEAAGCKVKLLNSGSAEPRRQLLDTGGKLLVAIFRRFDPHIDEPQIWGAINRTRRAATAAEHDSAPKAGH